MSDRHPIGPREVLAEACRLAEELGTTPPHHMIAANLGCSRQHVTSMFAALEFAGRIEWVTRHTYSIVDAQWIPPPSR